MMMRTTITLDEDVARDLEDRMRQTGASFKQTVNELLRVGLLETSRRKVPQPFIVSARPMGLRPQPVL